MFFGNGNLGSGRGYGFRQKETTGATHAPRLGDSPRPAALWAWCQVPAPGGTARVRPAGVEAQSGPCGRKLSAWGGRTQSHHPHPPPSHPLPSPARVGSYSVWKAPAASREATSPRPSEAHRPVWPEPPGTCRTLGPSQHLAEFELSRTESGPAPAPEGLRARGSRCGWAGRSSQAGGSEGGRGPG